MNRAKKTQNQNNDPAAGKSYIPEYEEFLKQEKIDNWESFSDVREKIYSGVEVSEIVKQTEYYKHIGVCSDLLRLLTKECGCDANIGKICRIVGGYMEKVSGAAI